MMTHLMLLLSRLLLMEMVAEPVPMEKVIRKAAEQVPMVKDL